MQGVHLLGIVLTVFVLLWMVSIFRRREGFYSDAEATAAHNEFNVRQQKLYSKWNVALKAADKEGALGTDTTSLFGSVIDTVDSNNSLQQQVINPYPVTGGEIGESANITACESVTTQDCNIFDDATFNTKCGMCLDLGKDSKGKGKTGGLLLSRQDKASAESMVPAGTNKIPQYEPTIGTCPDGMFVANKAQCLRLKNQLECAKKSTFNTPSGCSQCYTDGTFSIVDTTTVGDQSIISGYGTISLYGIGIFRYKQSNSSFPSKYTNLSETTATTISVNGEENANTVEIQVPKCVDTGAYNKDTIYSPGDVVQEGSKKYIMVEGAGMAGFAPSRPRDQLWQVLNFDINAAYISGHLYDDSTEFKMDLYQLISSVAWSDNTSGRKPRIMGGMTKNGVDMTKMSLLYGKRRMTMKTKPSFTFVDPSSYEATLCKNSPFITKQESATFLGSDPCYKTGQNKPGLYNMECLQKVFLDNGCLSDGKGFPTTSQAATKLLYNNGVAQTISEIANYIYEASGVSSTGRNASGNTVSMTTWSQVSEFCTGRKIASPCDADPPTGPFSKECILYLWENQGENNPAGRTYNVPPNARSLFSTGKKNRFCTRSGLMSPVDTNGADNPASIDYFKNMTSVRAIKTAMNNIWSTANNNSLSETDRVQAMNQCYGLVPGSPIRTVSVVNVGNWQSTSKTGNMEGFTGETLKCSDAVFPGLPQCKNFKEINPGESSPACGDRVSVFGKANFGEYNFSIPIGTYNTLQEIRSIPGNNGYTIYGHDGNVSFAFPKGCKLKLTINNGPNFSGPVSYVFTKSCPQPMITGACGQYTWNSQWTSPNHFAQSIKLELLQAIPPAGIPPPSSISNPPKVFLKGSDYNNGNMWYDRSGNDNNAILKVGKPSKNSGNNGIVFDGSTAWSFPNLNMGSGSWTASIWYKHTGTPVGNWSKCILCQQDAGNGKNNIVITYDWSKSGSNNLTGGYSTPNNGGFFGSNIPLVNNDNVWIHLVVTYDGSSVKTYVNQRLLSTTPSTTPSIDGGGAYMIGGYYQNQNGFIVGEIGELRVYNYSFSASQVSDDYMWSGSPYISLGGGLLGNSGPGFNY